MQIDLATEGLHPESPLQVPLIRQALTDQHILLSPRRVDGRWQSKVHLPSTSGFNPYSFKIYLPFNHVVFDWLKNPAASARPFNHQDQLMQKLLLVVHDYLHSWSILAVRHLMPDLAFGQTVITKENFEDMVFCHLLTEAAAVAGADYWYWSRTQINALCPIGTKTNQFAVSFKEKDLPEFQRYCPDFNPLNPSFLSELIQNYCRGDFSGFDLEKIKESPLVEEMVLHEVNYSHMQRLYSRRMISAFSAEPDDFYLSTNADLLKKPVNFSEKWKQELTNKLADLLWKKISQPTDSISFKPPEDHSSSFWKNKKSSFMYTNVNSLGDEEIAAVLADSDWSEDKYWFWIQYISTFDLDQFSALETDKIRLALMIKSQEKLVDIFKHKQRLKIETCEPRSLFIPN